MAKRRKYKKSSKCPEPFNTLIDIASAISMNAIANKMEKKYHYSQKGKINPYKVAAFKIGTDEFETTEEIIRTGCFLGAMGSFDVEADPSRQHYKMINVVPEDPIFNQIKYSSTINNKYAWRLNCEDGSEYGIDPCNYETRDEYTNALKEAKMDGCNDNNDEEITDELTVKNNEKPISTDSPVFCRVSLLSNGKNVYALSNSETIKVGDKVLVSIGKIELEAIVISVETHTNSTSFSNCEKIKIIKKI